VEQLPSVTASTCSIQVTSWSLSQFTSRKAASPGDQEEVRPGMSGEPVCALLVQNIGSLLWEEAKKRVSFI
jgi:hypothetical protein